MDKSEFTNVKKLQDPFPRFCCFREELRPRNTKEKIPSWDGKLCLHFFLSLEVDLGNKGLHLGVIIIFANISYVPKSEMNNFNRSVPNYTSAALQKETKNGPKHETEVKY